MNRRFSNGRLAVWVGLAAAILLLTACPPKPVTLETALVRLSVSDYPDFADDARYERLAPAVAMSLDYLRKLPAERPVHFGPDSYSVDHLIRSLEAFAALAAENPPADRLNRVIRERFRVYAAAGDPETGRVLFTGYYEPLLQGSLTASRDFPVAIHSRPADLVEIDLSPFAEDLKGRRIVGRYADRTVTPYPDRAEIRRQPDFDRVSPPLAWVRDEVDLSNLMIQGSGKVALADGRLLQVQFDGSNGHPFRSIGRLLIDQGKISADRISMQAIRDYLRSHPDEAPAILNHNPRYIFFRLAESGPVGALAVPITPLRTIAVDRGLYPSAALGFIAVPMPKVDGQGRVSGFESRNAFVLAQDAGSAITGPGRVDFFWGYGPEAEAAAGQMKNVGRLYFLVLDPELPATRAARPHGSNY
jgi:membrane-bound lytic murein transglycosylase A